MPYFQRYIGIDYSGAMTPTDGLKGLRVYETKGSSPPEEVPPPPCPRKYWTRRGPAHALVDWLSEEVPTLVGIDHGFSFPLRCVEKHGLDRDWDQFLDDFCLHWPTDEEHHCVDFIRNGRFGNGGERTGSPRWRRLTEVRTPGPKSVFHFDIAGQVAHSTHAGLPWLRFMRRELGSRVHFWPFDGWEVPVGRSAMVEVYPSLWRHEFAKGDRTGDQHDAYCIAAWRSRADGDNTLHRYLTPAPKAREAAQARVEGWILGVLG